MQVIETESVELETFPRTEAAERAIVAQLEQILVSPHFRQSKRSALLLRFLVERTLKGQQSVLKERILGVEVFGRKVDYDTSVDPVVRMTAGEIRKRIAQYYHDEGHASELRIDLEPGSYVAHFRICHMERPALVGNPLQTAAAPIPQATPEPATPDSSDGMKQAPAAQVAAGGLSKRKGVIWTFGIILIGLALALALIPRRVNYIALAWGDLLTARAPLLITIGQSRLYLTNSNSLDSSRPMTTSEHLQTGQTLSYSEAQTLVRLVMLLDHRRQFNLKAANDADFSDMRKGPNLLLGGLNNPWTMRAQQVLPIRLATDGNGFNWIEDSHHPGDRKRFVDSHLPYSNLTMDYAIVARFQNPSSHEPTLIVAGLGENGTKAAGEFITDEEAIQQLLGGALEKANNFEVLLQTQVINGASGPPILLAKEVW